MIVCLDGPAGSGKSTISKTVAEKTAMVHLDTGAFYRSLALEAKRLDISWDDDIALASIAEKLEIKFVQKQSINQIFLNSREVTADIRTPEMGLGASQVSRHKPVREKIVKLQQKFGENNSLVAEGRDAGTVIFPNAELKIYLDASLEERARRRFKDFENAQTPQTLDEVMRDLEKRDLADSTREASPLKKANDAKVLDTTHMTPEQVVNTIVSWIENYAS